MEGRRGMERVDVEDLPVEDVAAGRPAREA